MYGTHCLALLLILSSSLYLFKKLATAYCQPVCTFALSLHHFCLISIELYLYIHTLFA
jgi:hypothetical protein